MLIHPWDVAEPDEWSAWLDAGRDFGTLIASTETWPVVVPTHFVRSGADLLVHLARPNPIRRAIEANPHVTLSVTDDYAYIPSTWRVADGTDVADGVPTSYYSAVELRCRAEIIDDPEAKAELLRVQLAHFQPEGGHGEVATDDGPYHRMLSGIFGLRLTVVEARAKTKVDDHKPRDLRDDVSRRLGERARGRDLGARAPGRSSNGASTATTPDLSRPVLVRGSARETMPPCRPPSRALRPRPRLPLPSVGAPAGQPPAAAPPPWLWRSSCH